MKSTFFISLAAAFCLLCAPLFMISSKTVSASGKPYAEELFLTAEKSDIKTFRIKTDKGIENISAKDYIIGVLCGEISPLYEKEAIKAQAVAAYTFACRRASYAESVGRDYDLTDNPSTDQCYIDKKTMREKWGEKADEYYKIFESAADEVAGEWLCYDNSVALTVYHAVSPGKTNSAKDVWGNDVAYLVSVESTGDKLSPAYLSEADISETDLANKLIALCRVTPGENAFGDIKTAESALVLSAAIGGKTLSGGDIAAALSLKSAAFTVEYSKGIYHFTVYGSGHGVGMSQTGAEYMAKQGSNYKEILLHYYPGCKLKKS